MIAMNGAMRVNGLTSINQAFQFIKSIDNVEFVLNIMVQK
jgi:hypothetical protein